MEADLGKDLNEYEIDEEHKDQRKRNKWLIVCLVIIIVMILPFFQSFFQ